MYEIIPFTPYFSSIFHFIEVVHDSLLITFVIGLTVRKFNGKMFL